MDVTSLYGSIGMTGAQNIRSVLLRTGMTSVAIKKKESISVGIKYCQSSGRTLEIALGTQRGALFSL